MASVNTPASIVSRKRKNGEPSGTAASSFSRPAAVTSSAADIPHDSSHGTRAELLAPRFQKKRAICVPPPRRSVPSDDSSEDEFVDVCNSVASVNSTLDEENINTQSSNSSFKSINNSPTGQAGYLIRCGSVTRRGSRESVVQGPRNAPVFSSSCSSSGDDDNDDDDVCSGPTESQASEAISRRPASLSENPNHVQPVLVQPAPQGRRPLPRYRFRSTSSGF